MMASFPISSPLLPASNPYAWIDESLQTVHKAHWYRTTQTIDSQPGPVVMVEGLAMVNFASNDYLGLAGDRRLAQAAIAAIYTYGTGSTGSRLLSGQRDVHRQLEQAIARLKQAEDAIVFSSGYLANLGTIAALVTARDVVFSDQYNHASLKSGAKLSGATVVDYAHIDLADLRQQLETHRSHYRRALIVTDSVFSMDGDLCPLPELLDLATAYDCMVLVDEAHATGVLGPYGAGAVEHFGCTQRPLIQVGTLSKALGSLGGYVAGSAALIDWLRNRAASWIYTTAATPADMAAALVATQIIQAEPERRSQLWANVHYLQEGLDQLFPQRSPAPAAAIAKRLPSASPIICLQVKDAATVLEVQRHLQDAGIFVAAVRPPTVPTSRLRLTVMATHTSSHLDRALTALDHLLNRDR